MRKLLALMAVVAGLAGAPRAQAGPILDFGVTAKAKGTISYTGGSAPLVGAGISVANIVGLDTPAHDFKTLALKGGTLDFTTGNLVSSDATHWDFGPGGSITIEAKVPKLGLGSGTVLLSGTFLDAEVTKFGSGFRIVGADFTATLNATLASYFGLAGGSQPYDGNFNISFEAPGPPRHKFHSDKVLSGDVTASPAPEPSTLALAGIGALGLLGYAGRRRRRAAIS